MTQLTDIVLKDLKPADNERGWYEIQDDGVRCEGTLCHLRIRVGGPRKGQPPKKSWSLYYRANRPGAKRRNKTFGYYPDMSLKEARTKATAYGADCQQGIDPFAKGRARQISYAFGHLAEKYFDHISKPENPDAGGAVPRILRWQYRKRLIEVHVLPHWRDLDVREITTEMALDVIAEARFRPDDRETRTTADKLRSFLNQMFKRWKEQRIVTINPIRAIECFRLNRTRDVFLEPDDIQSRLWPFLENEIRHGTLARAFRASAFQLALLEGMRFGEVTSSRWHEIDEDREWLTVPPHRFFKGRRIPGSNKPQRTLHAFIGTPLGRAFLRRLEALRDETVSAWGIKEPLEWMFPTPRSHRWIRPSGKEMTRYREATGIPELGWHVLRHTFGTLAEGELGLERIDIGRAMNHTHESLGNGSEPRAPRATSSYIHPTDARTRAKVKPVFEAWHGYLADLVKAPEVLPGRAG